MYKVIVKFADMEDGQHIYEIGDSYPREGYEPDQKRIDFLASDENKIGTPVIEFIPEESEVAASVEETQEPSEKKPGKKSK